MKKLDLNQNWKFTWTEYTGNSAAPELPAESELYDARVPGDIHADLMRHGVLPDLYFGRNLNHARWTETKDWWYVKRFDGPEDSAERHLILRFHGLDTFATVWLNGERIGATDNMFIRHEFDVTGKVRPSSGNTLVVRFSAPAYSIHVDAGHTPMTWSPERLFCRKAQMSFGWDIAPRLVTTGIWRPVELLVVDSARIADVHPTVRKISGGDAEIGLMTEIESFESSPVECLVTGTFAGVDWRKSLTLSPGVNRVEVEIVVKDAPLWYCIGNGKAECCDCEVRLELAGVRVDAVSFRTGIRRIELVQTPQPSGATSFKFRCNGEDVFVTGLNWTPPDAIFTETSPEKITGLLEKMAAIGCNMLRVWGGGIYESDHFYRECDRLGIMIWQDFMMACGWYPQDDAFNARMEAEADRVVRDLRNHPCLALWAGDNEVDCFYPGKKGENRLTYETIAGVCESLDPETPYLPSSPFSPFSPDPQSEREGDVHHYAHGDGFDSCHLWHLQPRFISEFGHLSLPSMAVVERYFPQEDRWPVTNGMWRFHAADTMMVKRFRGTECNLKSMAACNIRPPETLESAIGASQELQADAVCAWIERYCADPEFDGFMIWNVTDCWPQQSDSIIDYAGNPKKIYYRLEDFFKKIRRDRQKHRETEEPAEAQPASRGA